MNPQYIKIDTYGNKFYYSDKAMTILHLEDGPAIEWSNGSKSWYRNGKLHREDGPAVEWPNGHKAWWPNGHKAWWLNGKLHREDGPAIECSNGSKSWYLNGKNLSEQEFLQVTAQTIELTLDEIAAKFGVSVEKLKIKK